MFSCAAGRSGNIETSKPFNMMPVQSPCAYWVPSWFSRMWFWYLSRPICLPSERSGSIKTSRHCNLSALEGRTREGHGRIAIYSIKVRIAKYSIKVKTVSNSIKVQTAICSVKVQIATYSVKVKIAIYSIEDRIAS